MSLLSSLFYMGHFLLYHQGDVAKSFIVTIFFPEKKNVKSRLHFYYCNCCELALFNEVKQYSSAHIFYKKRIK